jgi:hypothetical protein
MPLNVGGEIVYTSHASKKSKISLKLFEAHTSVLIPLMALPVLPFMITVKIAFFTILVLILLERRGWTLGTAFKRLRSRLAGRHRSSKTRSLFSRRMKDY